MISARTGEFWTYEVDLDNALMEDRKGSICSDHLTGNPV